MTARRFPPSWTVDELEACLVVKDGAGQKLAFVYFEEAPRPEIVGQAAHEGRGAKGCGEYCEVARSLTQIKSPDSCRG